jgi:hypothetical protein
MSEESQRGHFRGGAGVSGSDVKVVDRLTTGNPVRDAANILQERYSRLYGSRHIKI